MSNDTEDAARRPPTPGGAPVDAESVAWRCFHCGEIVIGLPAMQFHLLQAHEPPARSDAQPVDAWIAGRDAALNVYQKSHHSDDVSVADKIRALTPPAALVASPKPAEVDAGDTRDAARYRWLRSIDTHAEWRRVGHYAAGALDAKVDSAMAAATGGDR